MNRFSPALRFAAIAIGLMGAGTSAYAKVYRCVVNGSTTYMDRPCPTADSEAVNLMVPPGAASAASAASAAVPAKAAPTPAPAARTAAVVMHGAPPPETAAAPAKAAAAKASTAKAVPAVSAGPNWRLAGEYSDQVRKASKTLKRSSYGIECTDSRRRPSVYSINGHYSLTPPPSGAAAQLQGPVFDSLEAAASAACAAK